MYLYISWEAKRLATAISVQLLLLFEITPLRVQGKMCGPGH